MLVLSALLVLVYMNSTPAFVAFYCHLIWCAISVNETIHQHYSEARETPLLWHLHFVSFVLVWLTFVSPSCLEVFTIRAVCKTMAGLVVNV